MIYLIQKVCVMIRFNPTLPLALLGGGLFMYLFCDLKELRGLYMLYHN